MTKAPEENTPFPQELIWLKRLVIILAGVMIAGFLVLIATLVIRLRESAPVFPETLSLPEGATPLSITRAADWIAVVTTENEILILSADGQSLLQTLEID